MTSVLDDAEVPVGHKRVVRTSDNDGSPVTLEFEIRHPGTKEKWLWDFLVGRMKEVVGPGELLRTAADRYYWKRDACRRR